MSEFYIGTFHNDNPLRFLRCGVSARYRLWWLEVCGPVIEVEK
jgi:hypothetical protein